MKKLFFTTLLSSIVLLSISVNAYDNTNDDAIYESTSGTKYKYDLNNPSDKIMYDVDPSAQLQDSINVNPNVQLDRNIGEYGGGIIND